MWRLICFLQKNEIKQFSSSLFRLTDEASMKNITWFFLAFIILVPSFLTFFFSSKAAWELGTIFSVKQKDFNLLYIYSPAQESHHLICFLLGFASRVAGVLSKISMIFHFPSASCLSCLLKYIMYSCPIKTKTRNHMQRGNSVIFFLF